MKFDELFEYLGEVGTYQGLMFVLASIISILGVEAISVNFVTAWMDHWCEVDGLQNFPHEQQKYIAIPQNEDGTYANCDQFNINYANYSLDELRQWNRSTMTSNDTTTTRCRHWVYDRGEFASTSVSKFDLVCSRQDLVPLISTLFMVGIMIGSFVSGPLSDRIGRRPTIMIFVFIKIVFGFMGAFANNFAVFAVARVFLGLGGFSAYLVAYVLAMELVGPIYRTFLGVCFQMAYSFGMLLLSGMAYAIRDEKWLQFAYLLPAVVLFSLWWLLPESPRWLLLKGRYEQADKMIRRIAAVNRRNLPAHFDIMRMEQDTPVKNRNWTHIFKSKRLRNQSIVINLYWFTVNLIYYALSFNIGYLSGSVFVNTVISGAVEIPANLLCIVLCNWSRLGRRLTCMLALVLAGVSCFIRVPLIMKGYDMVDTGMAFVGRALVTIGFSGIYVYASEVFPTEVRNAGLSFAVVFAQISGIVSPYIGGPLTRVWAPLPAVLFGVLSLVSGLSVLVLPETLGKQLFDTIEEAENFGRDVSESSDIDKAVVEPYKVKDSDDLFNVKFTNDSVNVNGTKSPGCLNPSFIMTEFSSRL